MDWFWIVDYESLVHRRTIDERILYSECHKSSQIRIGGFANPGFKIPVLWIRFETCIWNYPIWGFVSEKIQNFSIRIASEGFVHKSRNLSYTAFGLEQLRNYELGITHRDLKYGITRFLGLTSATIRYIRLTIGMHYCYTRCFFAHR